MFEIVELAMTGVFGAVFAGDVRQGLMSSTQLALLLSATSIGAVIGSPSFGWLADRYGRRVSLALALALASLFSVWGALSGSSEELIIARLAASLGIGAYMPLAATYMADVLPRHLVGRALMLNVAISGLGGVVCGFMTSAFGAWQPLGLDGWRCSMLFGAAGTMLCAAILLRLPESPRWLAARGRLDEALREMLRFEAAPFRAAWARSDDFEPVQHSVAISAGPAAEPRLWDPVYRGRMLLVIILQFAIPWCTTSYANFTGWVFAARGYSTGDALVFQGIVMFGVSGGAVLSILFVDRIRRTSLLLYAGLLIAAAAVAFTLAGSVALALVAGLVIAMTGAVYSWVLMLYTAEIFPPLLRGKSSTIAYGVNRASSMLIPFVLLPLLTSWGEISLYGTMAFALGGCSLLIFAFDHLGARRRGPHRPAA